jgi:hypothetical protein
MSISLVNINRRVNSAYHHHTLTPMETLSVSDSTCGITPGVPGAVQFAGFHHK